MNQVICSIRDSKAEAWLAPMTFQSQAAAVRAFQDAVNSRDHQMAAHPEDYTLFELGTFDERTGRIVLGASAQSLALGANLVRNDDGSQLNLVEEVKEA